MGESVGAVEKIVIVGGGTSGWLTAAFLSNICGPKSATRFDITLVEAKDIGIIGVGEATIPTLRNTIPKTGIAERVFFRECNASFKLGIKFVDWHYAPEERPGDTFWNPFGVLPTAWSVPAMDFWLAQHADESPEHFTDLFTVHTQLAREMKCAKAPESGDFEGLVSYAYHMDTRLFGRLLREKSMARGVQRIEDKVTDVVLDERGWIEKIQLAEHGELSADLYIDCTGFRALLLQQAMGERFNSFEKSLLCDSAIAISKPWPEDLGGLRPYTTATAHRAGWSWNIPLQSREACGYVYSAKHVTPDEAETEFRKFIGDEKGENPALHIKMKTGRVDNFWVNNCIAIGLSGGFIEPLESTGIYMVEAGLYELEQYFPNKDMSQAHRDLYNRHMRFTYDQTKDFIVYHYCMTEREDTAFWRDNKYGLEKPEELQALLRLWESKVPSVTDFTPLVFSQDHYSFLMVGHRAWPKARTPRQSLVQTEDLAGLVRLVDERKKRWVPLAVDQLTWLRENNAGKEDPVHRPGDPPRRGDGFGRVGAV